MNKRVLKDAKSIDAKEQKALMLDILKYVDAVCRKNGIKYSLTGGSLIGAVRHHGFIPWDDDIDIILTEKNYRKLVRILDKETGRYQTYRYGKECEKMGFRKFIDTKTYVLEDGFVFDPNYGIYIDIFSYCPLSDDDDTRRRQFNKLKYLLKLVVFYRRRGGARNDSYTRKIIAPVKALYSRMIGCKRISRMYDAMCKEGNYSEDSKYIVCTFPSYSFEKEIQLRESTIEYTDAKFEGFNAMIFKNYDKILHTTFGDYMKLPPKSEQVAKHNLKAWWR